MALFGTKTRATRRRLDKTAWIAAERDFALRPCTIVDISDDGARLRLEDVERLPRHFQLLLSRATREGKSCELRWRRGNAAGVKFIARR
jgi:hypothetical protein